MVHFYTKYESSDITLIEYNDIIENTFILNYSVWYYDIAYNRIVKHYLEQDLNKHTYTHFSSSLEWR